MLLEFTPAWPASLCTIAIAGASCLSAPIGFAAGAPVKIKVEDTQVITPKTPYYCGWPTIGAKKNGDLIVVYSGGRDYHICPFGRVEEITSRDEGKTWSWPRTLLDSVTDDRDAGILETAQGTLIVTTFTSDLYQLHLNNPERALVKAFGDSLPAHLERWKLAEARTSPEEKKADVGMWFLRSTDGGKTWSERLPAPCNSPHGPAQLADGRLLYVGKELWTENKRVGAWESKDDGLTWQHLSDLPVRPGESLTEYHEVHAVEAADGTIIVQIRNHNKKPKDTLQTESKDGGKTWTEPREIGVTGYPTHLLRLKDGTLLMTYSFRQEPYGIRGKTSKDNGKTWSEEFRITEDGASWDLGYPSTVQLPDGSLITVWYEVLQDAPQAVIRQAKWKIEP